MPISQPVYTNTLSCPPLLDPPPLPLLLLLLLPAVPHVRPLVDGQVPPRLAAEAAASEAAPLFRTAGPAPPSRHGRDAGPAVSAGQYIYE